jgi:hypothetical protein
MKSKIFQKSQQKKTIWPKRPNFSKRQNWPKFSKKAKKKPKLPKKGQN